jgi:hypothetical protein
VTSGLSPQTKLPETVPGVLSEHVRTALSGSQRPLRRLFVRDFVRAGQLKGARFRRNGPLTCGDAVAGTGFEPVTSGL